MTGTELSDRLHGITRNSHFGTCIDQRDVAACEVFIDTGKSRKPIAEAVYDEENKYIKLIPEAKSRAYGKKESRK